MTSRLVQEAKEYVSSKDVVLDKTAQVLKDLSAIQWANLANSSIIDRKDVSLLSGFTDASLEDRLARLDHLRSDFFSFFCSFLSKVTKIELQQCVLVLFRQVLEQDPQTAAYFHKEINTNPKGPSTALVNACFTMLESSDWFVAHTATHVLKVLVSDQNTPERLAHKYVGEIVRRFRNLEADVVVHDACAAGLQAMLRLPSNRALFAGIDDALSLVASLLKRYREKAHPQMLYVLMYSVWLLSFDETIAPRMGETLLGPVIEIARKVSKEKVVRLCLAVLRNLQRFGHNSADMIVLDLVKLLGTLSQRNWDDEDVIADIKFLLEALAKDVHELSSYDSYRKELLSGELTWSPVHKTETFWREHIMKFEASDYQMLRYLSNLLTEPQSPVTLAVAAFDVGEFIRFHPHGKAIATQLGFKPKLMALLTHADPRVRKESLLAVQKFMVQDWQFLSGGEK